jgi:DNA-binding NtrC family response regulator
MQALAASLARVAATEVPVLICGETGSGKSTLARQVYEDSTCHEHPLVVIHAATATPAAIEALRESDHVSVLIEEVGDLPPSAQDALIRVVSQQPKRSRLRLLSTTSRDLADLVERHSLRADLAYRLDVVRLEIPPLRQRPEDILFLAEHFLVQAARSFKRDVRAFAPDAEERLRRHSWPGNVRELHNCITESVLYCLHMRLRANELRIRTAVGAITPESELAAVLARVHAAYPSDFYHYTQRALLHWALQACGGNRVRTAAFLGIGRGALRAKLRRYGLDEAEESSAVESKCSAT